MKSSGLAIARSSIENPKVTRSRQQKFGECVYGSYHGSDGSDTSYSHLSPRTTRSRHTSILGQASVSVAHEYWIDSRSVSCGSSFGEPARPAGEHTASSLG